MVLEPISGFQYEYRWLSNFWPCEIPMGDSIYRSVEAAYVASKVLDPYTRRIIHSLATSGLCKKFGKILEDEGKVRSDWSEVKLGIMHSLVIKKFTLNLELQEKLIATGDRELIETNSWGDVYWGVCGGIGENNLGKILMEVRGRFQ